jgi:hypothetical protein
MVGGGLNKCAIAIIVQLDSPVAGKKVDASLTELRKNRTYQAKDQSG